MGTQSPPARLTTVPNPDASLDPRAFGNFFEAHGDRLYGALCVISGNRHEAEDLTQDAFVRVWERWDRVQALEDPVGYLYRTAMNAYRRSLRRRVLARRFGSDPPREGDAYEAADAGSVVWRGLQRLSPRQRAALVLTELLGYSSAEAGRILGVKPVTARVLSSQGQAAMRRAVGEPDV